MKKPHAILFLLLCLSLGLSLCACGSTASAAAVEAAPAAQAAEPADNSAPEAPGEEPAYDPAAYEAAAQAVKDEFIQVILDGLDEFDEDAHPELPWYTAALTRFEENSFYEARHDFDGNGVPELLIGAGFGDYLSPIAVYAFDGRDMHYLCREVPLGERVHLSRADDLFVVRASDGAAAGSLTFYRIAEDGSMVETEERTEHWAWKLPSEDAAGKPRYVKLAGDVRMSGVDFGYVEGKTVLHDISLFAKPGQKIAFVGSTGAGKTTITNLINRFYDIEDGKIRYDGININHIKKDDLRRSLGMVLQETNLFTGTIMENIRYGRPDATDEEVYAAAKLANADYFISRLPEGYQTVISGTGSQLSQGQCQLLSIARCAVADPPVMILDEATSSVDTRTESLIQKGMDQLMEGRTVFVIAHRLSTIQNSNAIMVMEHGRIIERGDHDELMALKGRYYQLYTGNQIAEA